MNRTGYYRSLLITAISAASRDELGDLWYRIPHMKFDSENENYTIADLWSVWHNRERHWDKIEQRDDNRDED